TVNTTTTTSSSGTYSFTNLRPGAYTVTETLPPSTVGGTDTAGSGGGTPGTNQVSNIIVTSGTTDTGYTFADLQPSSISGTVFTDTNDNGVQNIGENGINGVTETLPATPAHDPTVNTTTTTSSSGTYSFTNL